jgi:hypothetical protein
MSSGIIVNSLCWYLAVNGNTNNIDISCHSLWRWPSNHHDDKSGRLIGTGTPQCLTARSALLFFHKGTEGQSRPARCWGRVNLASQLAQHQPLVEFGRPGLFLVDTSPNQRMKSVSSSDVPDPLRQRCLRVQAPKSGVQEALLELPPYPLRDLLQGHQPRLICGHRQNA